MISFSAVSGIKLQGIQSFVLLGTAFRNSQPLRRQCRSMKTEKIAKIQSSYSKEFTIHGLSRIFHGNPFESIFWFCWIAGMVSFAAYLGHIYYSRYANNEFRLETRIKDVKEITMPALTVCDKIDKSISCFKNKSLYNSDEDIYCVNSTHLPISFIQPCENCSYDLSDSFPGCITINGNASRKQRMKEEYPIAVSLLLNTDPKDLSFFMDDQEWIEKSNGVLYFSKLPPFFDDYYTANIKVIVIKEKTRISRLPKPYLSNCTAGNGLENMFSKKYSQQSCIQSCFMREMFDNCGTVIDRWQPFLTQEMKRKVLPNVNTTRCLRHHLNNFFEYQIPKRCDCPSACDEVEFENKYLFTDKRPSSLPQSSLPDGYTSMVDLLVRFQSMEEVSSQEIATYMLSDFLAELGGIIGNLVGMSVISVIELLVYIVLQVLKQLSR